MARRLAVAVVCVAGLCLGVATLRGEDAKTAGASIAKSADLRTALVGTWKMTSMKINGEKNDLPDQAVTYKHVTPAGFTWLSYEKESGKMFRAAGGTYTLKGDDYTETTQYGLGNDFGSMKDASHPFKCRIEGDTWYHVGRLADGTTIDEQWTRVKPADEPKRP